MSCMSNCRSRDSLSLQLGRLRSQANELSTLRDREQMKVRENAELSGSLADLEKAKANLEAELRTAAMRQEQLVKAAQHSANESAARVNNHQEASLEQVKSTITSQDKCKAYFYAFSTCCISALESKLSDEKSTRQRAEALVQEKERELSLMSVDFKQLQYRFILFIILCRKFLTNLILH